MAKKTRENAGSATHGTLPYKQALAMQSLLSRHSGLVAAHGAVGGQLAACEQEMIRLGDMLDLPIAQGAAINIKLESFKGGGEVRWIRKRPQGQPPGQPPLPNDAKDE